MHNFSDWYIDLSLSEGFGDIVNGIKKTFSSSSYHIPEKYINFMKDHDFRIIKTLAYGISNEDRKNAIKSLLSHFEPHDKNEFMSQWRTNPNQVLNILINDAKRAIETRSRNARYAAA